MADRVVAFARLHAAGAVIVAAPLAVAGHLPADQSPSLGDAFAGTRLVLPSNLPTGEWHDLLGGAKLTAGDDLGRGGVGVWPVAVLASA